MKRYHFVIFEDNKVIGGRYTTPYKIGILIGRLTATNPAHTYTAHID